MSFGEEWLAELDGECATDGRKEYFILPRVLSRAEVATLTAERPEVTPLVALAMQTLYSSGIRPTELATLQARDILPAGLRLNNRTVPVDPRTAAKLQTLANEEDTPVFPALEPEFLKAAELCGIARRYRECERCFRPSALRHAYAVHCLEGGMDLFALERLMGHENGGLARQYSLAAVRLSLPEYDASHPFEGRPRRTRRPVARYFPDYEREPEPERIVVAVPTHEEVLRLIAAGRTPRTRLFLRVYYATGLRLSELRNLQLGDVGFEERRLFVRSGKQDKDRYVLMDRETARLLREFCAGAPPGRPIFDLTVAGVEAAFRNAAVDSGLRAHYKAQGESLRLHSLRHAFASRCYQNDVDLIVLRQLLGHQTLETTGIYLEMPFSRAVQQYARSHEFAR